MLPNLFFCCWFDVLVHVPISVPISFNVLDQSLLLIQLSVWLFVSSCSQELNGELIVWSGHANEPLDFLIDLSLTPTYSMAWFPEVSDVHHSSRDSRLIAAIVPSLFSFVIWDKQIIFHVNRACIDWQDRSDALEAPTSSAISALEHLSMLPHTVSTLIPVPFQHSHLLKLQVAVTSSLSVGAGIAICEPFCKLL